MKTHGISLVVKCTLLCVLLCIHFTPTSVQSQAVAIRAEAAVAQNQVNAAVDHAIKNQLSIPMDSFKSHLDKQLGLNEAEAKKFNAVFENTQTIIKKTFSDEYGEFIKVIMGQNVGLAAVKGRVHQPPNLKEIVHRTFKDHLYPRLPENQVSQLKVILRDKSLRNTRAEGFYIIGMLDLNVGLSNDQRSKLIEKLEKKIAELYLHQSIDLEFKIYDFLMKAPDIELTEYQEKRFQGMRLYFKNYPSRTAFGFNTW